jgi:hypothetical protein
MANPLEERMKIMNLMNSEILKRKKSKLRLGCYNSNPRRINGELDQGGPPVKGRT